MNMAIEQGEKAVGTVSDSADHVALSASVIGMMSSKTAGDTATAPRPTSGAVLEPNAHNSFALTNDGKGKTVSPKSSSSDASDLGKN
jgi:hypothetical protein